MTEDQIYSAEHHAALFAKHGESFIRKRVEPFIRKVAMRVAAMDGLGNCEYVEISQNTTPLCVIVFADFDDGVRMWVREDDTENPKFDRWRDREKVKHQPHPWSN
jgi:hypothetical protein